MIIEKMTMQFISSISRENQIFKGRSYKIGSFVNGEPVIEHKIPIPDSDILCDWCNAKILTEKIKVVVNFDILTGKSSISYVICDNCKENKFNDIIEIKSVK